MPRARRANWTSSRHLRGSFSERQVEPLDPVGLGGGEGGTPPCSWISGGGNLSGELKARGRNGTFFPGRFPSETRRGRCAPPLNGSRQKPVWRQPPAARAGAVGLRRESAGCFMALRCRGWSWEQPTSQKATGKTRAAERPAGFSPPAPAPSAGAGKKLPFARDFEVGVGF